MTIVLIRVLAALAVLIATTLAITATVALTTLAALYVSVSSNGRPQPRLRRIARHGQRAARWFTHSGSVALVAVVG